MSYVHQTRLVWLTAFFLGLGSLAFSQLEPGQDANELTADQIASTLSADLSKARDLIKTLQKDVQLQLGEEYRNLEVRLSSNTSQTADLDKYNSQLENLKNRYNERKGSLESSIVQAQRRINDSDEIFQDLNNNFAGRLEETKPSLLALQKNISGSVVELEALTTMASGLRKDFAYEVASIKNGIDAGIEHVSTPPRKTSSPLPLHH